jgi:hypothetical protein
MTMIQTNITHILYEMTQNERIKNHSLTWLIASQKHSETVFIATDETSRIVCEFESAQQAADFHYYLKYSMYRLPTIKATMDDQNENIVNLDVNCDVVELFDSKRAGLCTLSRETGCSFRFHYRQMYTGSTLQGNISEGVLHHTQCIIRIFDALPQLSLSRIHQLLHTEEDIIRFNTMIIKEKAEAIR